MSVRSCIVLAAAMTLVLGLAPATATAAPARSSASVPAVTAATLAATPGAAGHDYATDTFADPWDYSNSEDLLLDSGPAMNASNPQAGNGWARMWFTDNGYVSPIWGGYGGPLFMGRDGGKPGNALNTAYYRTVSFEAYSNRDVSAGLFWFNCPRAVVGSDCGGGVPFLLKQGWNTYVLTPGASVFGGWPVGWGGSVTGLRLAVSPGTAGSDFALDWFRVTAPNSGSSVNYSNGGGGTADIVWDGDSDSSNNTSGQPNWGVLTQVSAAYGSVDLSALPAGSYRIGVRRSGTVSSWTAVTLTAPLPQFVTPNAVGDRDYASTVLGNPWDMNGPDDISAVGNATDVSYAGGQLAATNTSNDPFAALRLGSGGIDTRVYRNVTITSDYDGTFDLRDIAGGGTMGRLIWSRADGQGGQTSPILTYSGTRTLTFDMGLPDSQLLEPDDPGASFVSDSPVTALRWDPNEDRGARRWYLKDVQLRSDFATSGSFPIVWQDAAYQPGGTARITADTDRSGCDGTTVAAGVPVNPGANTTVWNTAGMPSGRYWLCLTITRGTAVTSGYAGGVLVVGGSSGTGHGDGRYVAAVTTGSTTTGYVIGLNRSLFATSVDGTAGYTSLGGTTPYGPAAVSWDGSRTDVFVIGTDNALYHRFKSGPNWSGWESLGGALTSSPAAVSFANGTLDIFARGTDGAMWRLRWTGTAWSGWSSLGGLLLGSPTAAVDRDTGVAHVGVRGMDGQLWQMSLRAADTTAPYSPTASYLPNAPGYATRAGDGERFYWGTTDVNGAPALVNGSSVTQLGGTLLGAAALVTPGATGYVVFGCGLDGALWAFDARSGSGQWRSLGGQII